MQRVERFAHLVIERVNICDIPSQGLIDEALRSLPAESELNDEDVRRKIAIELRLTKDSLLAETGINPQGSLVCAEFLTDSLAGDTLKRAEYSLQSEDLVKFQVFYDVASGIGFTLSPVTAAQNDQSDEKIHTQKLAMLVEQLPFPTDLQNQIDIYLRFQRDAQRFAQMLESDPSGFTLIDTVIDEFDNCWQQPLAKIPYNKSSFLGGAQYAQRMYKAVYPLTASLDH